MTLQAVDLRDPTLAGALREYLCWLYYDEIYKAAFPVTDEAEDPAIWLPLLSGVPPPPSPIVHVILAICDGRPPEDVDASSLLGGIIFEYFRTAVAALVTYLCVKSENRGQGIGKFLLDHTFDIIRENAGGAQVPLFAEAENPIEQIDPAIREAARKRLPILSRLGFRRVPIKYRQPALGAGKRPVDNLQFLLFTGGKTGVVKQSVLRAFMREFYDGLDAGPPDEARMFDGLTGEDVRTLDL